MQPMPVKTINATRVLQLMDREDNGAARYREFVEWVASEAGISVQQLETELEPFI